MLRTVWVLLLLVGCHRNLDDVWVEVADRDGVQKIELLWLLHDGTKDLGGHCELQGSRGYDGDPKEPLVFLACPEGLYHIKCDGHRDFVSFGGRNFRTRCE